MKNGAGEWRGSARRVGMWRYFVSAPSPALPREGGGRKSRAIAVPAACVMLALLSGCTYQLRGTVVPGPYSSVEIVSKDDPRLTQTGIPDARLEATIDPMRMSQKELGAFMVDGDGHFAIPVDVVGAGAFEYDLELVCRSSGYTPVLEKFRLPGANKRVLVVMAPGKDTLERHRDLLEESIEVGRQQGMDSR